MDLTSFIPSDPTDIIWDVVVIGTGAGGAAAGLTLARSGRSVLFLERGGDRSDPVGPLLDPSSGDVFCQSDSLGLEPPAYESGHSPLYVGSCVGGSTAVFAMVMDRFRPTDFQPKRFPATTSSASLSPAWPVQYEELEPYYREAEALFHVQGSDDPLAPTRTQLLNPPPESAEETVIRKVLEDCGLHPYRSHYARDYVPECDGCPGRICSRNCRVDASRACVFPALARHGAHILLNCLVVKLESRNRMVERALCLWNERHIEIRARVFVLALNALLTPALLLRSANDTFPEGLGNSSGLVGRNLMLHVSDFLYVRFNELRGRGPLNGQLRHGLSVNDFYVMEGLKFGNIHAHAMHHADPIPSDQKRDRTDGIAVFATIVEDFPYPCNRVLPKPGTVAEVHWEYTYPGELCHRSEQLVRSFHDVLTPDCSLTVRQPRGLLNTTHMCGTCRFGNDPSTSVLNRENRLHDLDNSYVVDGSFFPSSGGINPSLTIVANSLRVAASIAG